MEQPLKIVKLEENREKREIANTYRIDIECYATGASQSVFSYLIAIETAFLKLLKQLE